MPNPRANPGTSKRLAYFSSRRVVRITLLLVVLAAAIHYARQQLIMRAHAGADIPSGSVVELFTSHGCSSCPPADRVLAKLIRENPELIALEYHVNYWDTLVHGSAGSFKDPFSQQAFTDRQRSYYASRLAGRPGVYTPQIIVNGEYAVVGSRERRVRQALSTSEPRSLMLDVSNDDGVLGITVKGKATPNARAWLAVYDIEQNTAITGGENKGKALVNHHVVRRVQDLGDLTTQLSASGEAMLLARPDLAPGQSCAVLVQVQPPGIAPGTMLGAANCPAGQAPPSVKQEH